MLALWTGSLHRLPLILRTASCQRLTLHSVSVTACLLGHALRTVSLRPCIFDGLGILWTIYCRNLFLRRLCRSCLTCSGWCPILLCCLRFCRGQRFLYHHPLLIGYIGGMTGHILSLFL